MSWASSRQTTRIEDIAYSLLGIFGVNMPLLYGEEERAFRRLQEEVIKSCPDLSILAWTDSTSSDRNSRLYCGVLAKTPGDFKAAGSISGMLFEGATGELSVTNRGIRTRGVINLLHSYIREKEASSNPLRHHHLPVNPELRALFLSEHRYILPLYCKSASSKYLGLRI
jgi:hypothetical protein